MSITIDLNPEIEARIAAQAQAQGLPVEDYLKQVIEKEALRPKLDELLEPLQKEFAQTGMTEEELDELIEKERQSIWEQK
jgi:hypothetical protein